MDPLRPFTDLVRTLWSNRGGPTATAEAGRSVGLPQEQQANAAPGAPDDLRVRLRNRLAAVGVADAARALEVFVEVVLTWEWGDGVSADPAFSEVVKAVADRIGERSQLSRQLEVLLQKAQPQRAGSAAAPTPR